jgi:hypothetical protein
MKKHLVLAGVPLSGWLFFYLIGIPSNYFSDWSFTEQILLSLITFFAAVPLIGFLTLLFIGDDYIKNALWLAFYGSFLLFLLDYIITGIIQGKGINFLFSHWYLSIAYIYVWPVAIIIAMTLNKLKSLTYQKNGL